MLMIKLGALRLKKSNLNIAERLFPCGLVFLLVFLFFSCKSTPKGFAVNPLDLLDSQNNFYLAVPKAADPELVKTVIKNNASDVSDKDINTALSRIDKIYVGLLSSRNIHSYQCAASCNIPVNFLPSVFTKKRGFSRTKYERNGINGKRTFDIYSSKDVNISVPDSNTMCVGRDLTGMLDSYASLSETGILPEAEDSDSVSQNSLSVEQKEYLDGAVNEIRFITSNPSSFLSMLTGVNLDMKLNSVTGEMSLSDEKPDCYVLDLHFKFKEKKFVKAGRALLSLAFGLSNSSTELISDTEFRVNGVIIGKETVLKLLTI